ncbi:beta-lactamase-like protein [Fimicolochytrium jonesii]|uniref:beta-lactamase-like protein n=1 Tax=Fimicolochytrium jonesii TaxID=1396493 RepID=UPI0022FDFAA9|nr:beta-lactamase-like protein [Fimicolochytrium jonesii]KAI8825010.1 beta-lactamase-like protein [Fimicolochytrium jonesii]
MRYYLQVLGVDSVDTSPTVLVHFDSQRYLFNCGEGTQRFCHEHKVRLSKVQNVFFTRVAWDCIGGLPGMLLTLADAGTDSLCLHGPRNMTHAMASTRHFIYREAVDVTVVEYIEAQQTYQDENLTIFPVQIKPELVETRATFASDASVADVAASVNRKRKSEDELNDYAARRAVLQKMFPGGRGSHPLSSLPEPAREPPVSAPVHMEFPAGPGQEAYIQPVVENTPGQEPHTEIGRVKAARLPRTREDPTILAYICRGPKVPGKFNAKAAIALGVKPGPDCGRLARGESVTLANGTTVVPDQVLGEEKPGAVFVIVECPSISYISPIATSPQLQDIQGGKAPVRCVVHILGPGVLDDIRYKNWMKKFSENTQHIVISRKHNPASVTTVSAGKLQYRLNMLDNEIFPLPYIPGIPKNVIAAAPLTNYILEPAPKLDFSECLKPLDFPHIQAQAKKQLEGYILSDGNENGASRNEDEEGVSVIPLGTGSAIPGKYRNVSSTLIKLPEGNILLDGGEGTLGQLYRHFGPDGLDTEIGKLRLIFLSHLHADHHLGLIRIIKHWFELRDRGHPSPLIIIAPYRFNEFLEEYGDCEDFGGGHVSMVNSELLRWNRETGEVFIGEENSAIQRLKEILHLQSVATVGVHHCPMAYGLVLKTHAGCKLVFSGDCRPSEDLVEAGKDATICVHEATLEDGMQKEAEEKRHCTTGEALDVGKRMRVRHLLLTHFSQRYPKIPVLPNWTLSNGKSQENRAPAMNVGIAYDLMRVDLDKFHRLPKLLPGLQKLFPSDGTEDGDDSASLRSS